MPDRPGEPGPETAGRLHIDAHLNDDGLLATMAMDVREGLTSSPKSLSPKYFYDDRGSDLFEQITGLPEYYLSRAEQEVLSREADQLMEELRPDELVELGSGSSAKTRLLLSASSTPGHLRRYVPFDVSESTVRKAAEELLATYPFLSVHGAVGDFTRHLEHIPSPTGRRLILFLGSTIGNLDSGPRQRFLSEVRELLGPEGRLLMGLDLVKDHGLLHAAYNDAAGVTAEFNRNILTVLNCNLRADFNPESFIHHAFFNAEASRIEMHLIAEEAQTVYIADLNLTVHLGPGEGIWTESSYKFTRESASTALSEAGMRLERWYTDSQGLFALALAAPA